MTKRTAIIGFSAFLLFIAGCASLRGNRTAETPPQVKASATVEQFVTHWNANSSKIDSLRCLSVDISGRAEGQPITLNAKLAYQQPDRFRLLGNFAGKSEVDLGANENEIWFWIARAEPPAVYYCNRQDLDRVRFTTPFEPDWIVEVLGVKRLDPRDYDEDYADDHVLTLVSRERTPGGQEVIKRIVIDRQTSRVSAFQLFDNQARQLAQAEVLDYFDDPKTGAFTPREVRLEWPETSTTLTVKLRSRRIELNTITPDYAASLFQRGKYEYTQEVNLAAASARAVQSYQPAPRRELLDSQVRQARTGFQDGFPTYFGGGR